MQEPLNLIAAMRSERLPSSSFLWRARRLSFLFLILLSGCTPVPPPAFPSSDTYAALQLLAALQTAPIRISVYPNAGFPSTFRILIRTARHADNRELCFKLPPDRESCHEVHGEAEPRSWTIYYEVRNPGSYTASADLTRIEQGQARHYVARAEFQVLGGFN